MKGSTGVNPHRIGSENQKLDSSKNTDENEKFFQRLFFLLDQQKINVPQHHLIEDTEGR